MQLTGLSRLSPCEGERIKVRGFFDFLPLPLRNPHPAALSYKRRGEHAEDLEILELLVD
jgi:hypothetical protein